MQLLVSEELDSGPVGRLARVACRRLAGLHAGAQPDAGTTSANVQSIGATAPRIPQDYAFEPSLYTGLPPTQEFPSVPYGPLHFHCERPLNSWTDPLDLNAGWLTGLTDLNTEVPYVQCVPRAI